MGGRGGRKLLHSAACAACMCAVWLFFLGRKSLSLRLLLWLSLSRMHIPSSPPPTHTHPHTHTHTHTVQPTDDAPVRRLSFGGEHSDGAMSGGSGSQAMEEDERGDEAISGPQHATASSSARPPPAPWASPQPQRIAPGLLRGQFRPQQALWSASQQQQHAGGSNCGDAPAASSAWQQAASLQPQQQQQQRAQASSAAWAPVAAAGTTQQAASPWQPSPAVASARPAGQPGVTPARLFR